MSQQDYDAIRLALTELGIAMVLGVEVWTLEQRKIYEKATEALVKYGRETKEPTN